MTNTTQPMTSREAFESFYYDREFSKTITKPSKDSVFSKLSNGCYWFNTVQHSWETWQACEQQNQAVIADLVEALEAIASRTQDDNLTWWQIKAREAIAKVKGK